MIELLISVKLPFWLLHAEMAKDNFYWSKKVICSLPIVKFQLFLQN